MTHPAHRPTRRQLLHVGGLSALGLGLPTLLHARSPAPVLPAGRAPERSCIFVVQYGGCSHIDSFDPKPDAPAETRGPYRAVPTRVPGVRLGELLPRLGNMADRFLLVRSMTHRDPGHDGGMHVAMTGHSAPTADTPYLGSVVARVRPATRNVPSYVWLQNLAGDVQPRYLGGGFLGPAYGPLRVGSDLDNPAAPGFRVRALDPAADVPHERMRTRTGLLNQLDPRSATAGPEAALRGFQERAADLLTGPGARRAFDLNLEPTAVRDRYGAHPLGQNLLTARRLVEAGVRLVSVTAWAGTPRGEPFKNVQTWDMHGEGAGLGSMFGTGAYGLGWALPNLDQAVSALLEDLSVRGLLDSTLVVVGGEFGRSPRIDRAGRDHWPACYSALVAGGGVQGGRVHGASDRAGGYVKDDPVSPERFAATVLHALGVPPETRLGADGFTRPAATGEPILGWFA